MTGTDNWRNPFLILCFSGPTVLLLWPVYLELSARNRTLVREGTIYFAVTVLFFFLFRIFTELPLIGGLFGLLSVFYWMAYIVACVWILVKKHGDPDFVLPFISTHAEQSEGRDVL